MKIVLATAYTPYYFLFSVPQVVAFQYGNITNGIQDESVFDIPSYC